ncbi:MAG: hypothetical protein AAF629_35970 [Chloroflexota bacterium]
MDRLPSRKLPSSLQFYLLILFLATVILGGCHYILFFPIGFIILSLFSIIFAFEDGLLGSVYLYTFFQRITDDQFVSNAFILGWILLPLLGTGFKQKLLIGTVTYGLIPGAFLLSIYLHLSPYKQQQIQAHVDTNPALKRFYLPLSKDSLVDQTIWSPNGEYIALAIDVNDNFFTIVVNATTGEEVIRTIGSYRIKWDHQNRLWKYMGNGWRIYDPVIEAKRPNKPAGAPFLEDTCETAKQLFVDCDIFFAKHVDELDLVASPARYQAWDFHIEKRRLIVAKKHAQDAWVFRLWDNNNLMGEVPFTPIYKEDRALSLWLSPNGQFATIKLDGWIGYETPGPEELWLLDIKKQEMSFIQKGMTKGWQLWDYDVQGLETTWFPDNQAVLVSDSNFGMEKIDTQTRKRVRLSDWNTHAFDEALSPQGQWVAYEVWAPRDSSVICDKCIAVQNLAGGQIVYLPTTFLGWPYIDYAWHPKDKQLAITTESTNGYVLLIWSVP